MQQEAALPYELACGSLALTPDTTAFEELYRSQGSRMKSVAMNLLGNTSDAEDAVQEAFLKLHRSWTSFKGESLLSTWLYRILVNTCYDMGRRRKRRPEPAALSRRSASCTLIVVIRSAGSRPTIEAPTNVRRVV